MDSFVQLKLFNEILNTLWQNNRHFSFGHGVSVFIESCIEVVTRGCPEVLHIQLQFPRGQTRSQGDTFASNLKLFLESPVVNERREVAFQNILLLKIRCYFLQFAPFGDSSDCCSFIMRSF